MGVQRTHFRNWDEERKHREVRIKKLEKIQGLESLVATWQPLAVNSDFNHQYFLELKRKLRCAQNQYRAMKQ
jgi:hypothetical protein